MEAGGRDITPFSDWFSMTPQLYNRPFSCFNFPFSWSLTSLCKSHHHTHLLPQMFEMPDQYSLGGSKCFEILRPNLERLRWSHLKDYVEKSNQRHWHMSAGWIIFNMVLHKTLIMDIWSEAVAGRNPFQFVKTWISNLFISLGHCPMVPRMDNRSLTQTMQCSKSFGLHLLSRTN